MPQVEILPVQSLSEAEFNLLSRMRLGFFNDMSMLDYGKPEEPEVMKSELEWFERQRKLGEKASWKIFVAKVNGKIAGYTTVNIVPRDKSVRSYEFFALPSYRKAEYRLGDRFVSAALSLGAKLGFKRMWIANLSTIPSNPGGKKMVERIIGQPIGKWPLEYPRSIRATRAYSRVFYTPHGAVGFAGDPNWARARAIRYRDTTKGHVKFPNLMIPINEGFVRAARARASRQIRKKPIQPRKMFR